MSEPMNEAECLATISAGGDAYALLMEADPNLRHRFKKLDGALITYLDAVREHFPDATYYTASGGFHLLLGRSHSDKGVGQQELIALSGDASISDGDF